MGLLADIYSGSDSLKRKVKGLLADPMGTLEQKIAQFGEDQQSAINNAQDATGFGGNRSVLMSPQQKQQASKALGDYAGSMGLAGMFVGQGSSTWNKAEADKALKMAQSGTDPRKIWSETGNWKGPDGAWRQEIPDNAVKYDPEAMADLKAKEKFNYLTDTQPLGGVVEHKKLFSAYPDSENIPVHFMPKNKMGDAYGAYSIKHDRITLNDGVPNAKQSSGAIHEIQHAIQQREGFDGGGSAKSMADVLADYATTKQNFKQALEQSMNATDPVARANAAQARQFYGLKLGKMKALEGLDANGIYKNLAGEAEARATQARIPLDASARRALFPEDSYDVPMNQLIIRGLLAK